MSQSFEAVKSREIVPALLIVPPVSPAPAVTEVTVPLVGVVEVAEIILPFESTVILAFVYDVVVPVPTVARVKTPVSLIPPSPCKLTEVAVPDAEPIKIFPSASVAASFALKVFQSIEERYPSVDVPA